MVSVLLDFLWMSIPAVTWEAPNISANNRLIVVFPAPWMPPTRIIGGSIGNSFAKPSDYGQRDSFISEILPHETFSQNQAHLLASVVVVK